jgi:hypothetical protein
MAFVSGTFMYHSIMGTMLSAWYHRTANWTKGDGDGEFGQTMRRVIERMAVEAQQSARKARVSDFNAVLNTLLDPDEGWHKGEGKASSPIKFNSGLQRATIALLSGDKNRTWPQVYGARNKQSIPNIDFRLKLHVEEDEDGEERHRLHCEANPTFKVAILIGTFYMTQLRYFKYAIVCYMVAQTMSALKGCNPIACSLVIVVISFWIWKLYVPLSAFILPIIEREAIRAGTGTRANATGGKPKKSRSKKAVPTASFI